MTRVPRLAHLPAFTLEGPRRLQGTRTLTYTVRVTDDGSVAGIVSRPAPGVFWAYPKVGARRRFRSLSQAQTWIEEAS